MARALSPGSDTNGSLHVEVWEDSSVQSCQRDQRGNVLIGTVTPGNTLAAASFGDARSFALDVSEQIVAGNDSALYVDAYLDENGNGQCDDDEPTGSAALERTERTSVAIVLDRSGCPVRD